MIFKEAIKKIYFWSSGYSYTNLGRLFLRLFVGVMFMQFGVKQMMDFNTSVELFPSIFGIESNRIAEIMIGIEIICSLFIMCGFLTRLMVLPPIIAMCVGEYYLLHSVALEASYKMSWLQPGYLPIMFMGIYFFILLVGPGKISVDYFLSLHIIHNDNKSEAELEEV